MQFLYDENTFPWPLMRVKSPLQQAPTASADPETAKAE